MKVRYLIIIYCLMSLGITSHAMINQKEVIIQQITSDCTLEQVASKADEVVVIERALVKKVDENNKYVMVLPEGKADEIENYIILKIDEENTVIESENGVLGDLEEDMIVYVEHSLAMTKSIPPQTTAKKIKVIEEPIPILENIVLPDMLILNIDSDIGIMEVGEAKDQPEVEYRVYIGEKTKVRHCIYEEEYTYKDLKEGMVVTIIQTPIIQPSYPPTITALEVVITKE